MLILLFYNDKNDEEAKTQKTPLHLQEETEEKVIPPSVLDGRMTFYIFSFSFFNGNFHIEGSKKSLQWSGIQMIIDSKLRCRFIVLEDLHKLDSSKYLQ